MSEFELRFLDLEITPWGGMALMRMANFKAIQRLLRRFDQGTNQRIFGRLWRDFFSQLHMDG